MLSVCCLWIRFGNGSLSKRIAISGLLPNRIRKSFEVIMRITFLRILPTDGLWPKNVFRIPNYIDSFFIASKSITEPCKSAEGWTTIAVLCAANKQKINKCDSLNLKKRCYHNSTLTKIIHNDSVCVCVCCEYVLLHIFCINFELI